MGHPFFFGVKVWFVLADQYSCSEITPFSLIKIIHDLKLLEGEFLWEEYWYQAQKMKLLSLYTANNLEFFLSTKYW